MKDEPVIRYSTEKAASGCPGDILGIAGEIADRLRQYPHYVKLTGATPTEKREPTIEIARALADMRPFKEGLTEKQRKKVSFTRVQIDPEKAQRDGLSTAYSRTNRALEVHTDSTFQISPHELVAFQMVRSDSSGGDTLLISIEDILSHLNWEIAETLCQPIFPFGKWKLNIFWGHQGSVNIRYYRAQIDNSCRKLGVVLDEKALLALDALDEVLRRKEIVRRFRIEAGETLFMHNTKVLHGRTGFSPESNRLMYRMRAHAGCLG